MNADKDIYFCGRCNQDTHFIFTEDMAVCEICGLFLYRQVKDKERKDE